MSGSPSSERGEGSLRRELSLTWLVLYGLGTTVGGGIYALTGEIAGLAGTWAWLPWAIACAVAAPTALSFGELASRYPHSAGEAAYLEAGFRSRGLARAGGLAIALAGATSAATLTHAAVGYLGLGDLVPAAASRWLVIAICTGIAAWGIKQSVGLAAAITLLEVVGVLAVTAAAGLLVARGAAPEAAVPSSGVPLWGIASGSVLAFYAFLGFEDMVNVAEEVVEPRRTLPRAIALTLAITLVLYIALAALAVRAVPAEELAASPAPLWLIYSRTGAPGAFALRAIAIAGLLNGALIQIVMGSRILYGLGRQGALPARLGRVHSKTGTPLLATVAIGGVVGVLAAGFELAGLARVTSWLTLAVFAAVNLALLRLRRDPDASEPVVRAPGPCPLLGAAFSLGLLALEILRAGS